MIDFSFSDEELLLSDTARAFAAKQLRPAQRDHERAGVSATARGALRTTELDQLWRAGIDVSALARCLVVEALAFGDAGASLALLAPGWSAGLGAQLGVGDRYLSDVVWTDLGALPDTLPWVPAAPGPVLQFTETGAWRVVAVTSEPVRPLGLSAAGASRCTVSNTLAEGRADPAIAAAAASELRRCVAAMLVGVAHASLDYAQQYVQERHAFGVPLAQHQALAFIVSDMALRTDAARLLVHADAVNGGGAHGLVEAIAAALFVTDFGVQLLGGHGYLVDHPVEKWMRDARALGLLAGGVDAAASESARDAWETPWS